MTDPQVMTFRSFGRDEHGRVVTAGGGYVLLYARNPYGTHNLVLADDTPLGDAFQHGTQQCLARLDAMPFRAGAKMRRRALRFLGKRGIRGA